MMEPQALWELFLRTGLPEAYSLYHLLKEEEAAAAETKSA